MEILCWDIVKCPSYRGVRLKIVRLVEVFYQKHTYIQPEYVKVSILWRFFYEKHTYVLPGHMEVSVLERCLSYGMSVLRGLKEDKIAQCCKMSPKKSNHPYAWNFFFFVKGIETPTVF